MFDPYHRWLGIPKDARPPTHYQILGLAPGESDPDVIDEAAIRQTTHLRAYQIGPHAEQCTKLLNEISIAKATLLNSAKKKAYDDSLPRVRTPAPTGITAQLAPQRRSPLADLDDAEQGVVSVARIQRSPTSGGLHLGLIAAGVTGVVVIGAVVVGLMLWNRAQPVEVAGGPPNKRKDAPNNAVVEPKKNEGPPVVPDPAVPLKKAVGPDDPTAKKQDKAAVPPRKIGGANVSIVLDQQLCMSIAFTTDRTAVAVATTPARILDAKTYAVVETLTDKGNQLTAVKKVMYTIDGNKLLIACANFGGAIAVFDRTDKSIRFLSRKDSGFGEVIVSAAISPQGRYAASTHLKGRVFIYDVATGGTLHILTPGGKQLDCRFLSDEKTLLTAGEDGILRLWEVETGASKTQHDFTRIGLAERAGIACVDLTPDERWVLFGYSKYCRRFDLQTEKPNTTTNVENDKVVAVAVSPDGQFFADVDEYGRYTVASDKTVWPARGEVNLGKVHAIAFGPNETLWITGQGGVVSVNGWAAKLRGEK